MTRPTSKKTTTAKLVKPTAKLVKPTAKLVKPTAKLVKRSGRAAEMTEGKLSLAAHYAKQHAATADAIEAAVRRAWPSFLKKTRGQSPYAFVLYTSGTSLFSYVVLSANTEEGLSEVAAGYLAGRRNSTLEQERASLRWNACDWAHHELATVARLRISKSLAIRSRYEDAAIWEAFALGLSRCDEAGLFGDARARITLAIVCGDMDARFFMKGVRRLNPSSVASRAQREWKKQFA